MILELIDKPIPFHRCLARLTGSVNAGILLSQAVYWAFAPGGNDTGDTGEISGERWFTRTAEEWEAASGLTQCEQATARKRLRELGIWHEERRGMPAKLYFRLDDALLERRLQEAV